MYITNKEQVSQFLSFLKKGVSLMRIEDEIHIELRDGADVGFREDFEMVAGLDCLPFPVYTRRYEALLSEERKLKRKLKGLKRQLYYMQRYSKRI